jgi:hypothetical protein
VLKGTGTRHYDKYREEIKMALIFTLKGDRELLEVSDDNISITPVGLAGFIYKGLKGTKTIPFSSITAVQCREASTFLCGYIQFTIHGGNESTGGLKAAVTDENSVLFVKKYNEIALKIKGFIEAKIKVLHAPPQVSHPSFVDELKKLAILKEQGILSEAEFSAAKNKLLMVEHQ